VLKQSWRFFIRYEYACRETAFQKVEKGNYEDLQSIIVIFIWVEAFT